MLTLKADSGSLVPLAREQTAAATLARYVAGFARAAFAEVDAANARALGHPGPARVTVDGRAGGALDQVNAADGEIIFDWSLVDDVLDWIWQTLIDRSPVASGRYRDSHVLLADGRAAARGAIPAAREYVFVNLQPYARRIEVGKTEAGRDFVVQVPNRIYARTAKDAAARFGNLARIRSLFIDPGAYSLRRDQRKRALVRGRLVRSNKAPRDRLAGAGLTAPAIMVTLNEGDFSALPAPAPALLTGPSDG